MIAEEQVVLRLVVAALLGADRQRRDQAAGLRTHALVGVGACLFMLVSSFGFGDVVGRNGVMLDPSRVAAQVGRPLTPPPARTNVASCWGSRPGDD